LEGDDGFWTERAQFMKNLGSPDVAAAIDAWTLSRTVECLARDPQRSEQVAFCTLELTAASMLGLRLLDVIARLLQHHQSVAAGKLCFVIDRRIIGEAGESLPSFCTAVRAMGCRVALDHELSGRLIEHERLRRIPAALHCLDASHFPELADGAPDQIL